MKNFVDAMKIWNTFKPLYFVYHWFLINENASSEKIETKLFTQTLALVRLLKRFEEK